MPRLTPRRLTPRAKADLDKRLERFVRTENWGGLRPGDPVRIKGVRGGIWRYRCHVVNSATGAAWVEVSELEPVPGVPVTDARRNPQMMTVKTIRTFDIERITKLPRPRSKRTREFEQLDFGYQAPEVAQGAPHRVTP